MEKRLLSLPLHDDSILEAAATAEEFLTLFPGAAEALLTNCTSVLSTGLKTPADFAKYSQVDLNGTDRRRNRRVDIWTY